MRTDDGCPVCQQPYGFHDEVAHRRVRDRIPHNLVKPKEWQRGYEDGYDAAHIRCAEIVQEKYAEHDNTAVTVSEVPPMDTAAATLRCPHGVTLYIEHGR